MKDTGRFRRALSDVNVPFLVLDAKWHRLFSIYGKTKDIAAQEAAFNRLLAEQAECGAQLKSLRGLKSTLLDNIVANMDGADEGKADSLERRRLKEDRRLIEKINEKMDIYEERLLDLPRLLREKNEDLMLSTMEYCYEKMRVNEREAEQISEWIRQMRIALKKKIIQKQDCVQNSREIYAFLHDIFGSQTLDLFDMEYEKSEAEETGEAGSHSQ